MARQNRFSEAVVAAAATVARLKSVTAYAMAIGELAFSSDTLKLYAANSLNGGDWQRVHGLDLACVDEDGNICTDETGEIVWDD
jgi:hypothetical protein